MRWDAGMIARDFVAAQEAVDGSLSIPCPSVYSAPVPKSYLRGCIALAAGEHGSGPAIF